MSIRRPSLALLLSLVLAVVFTLYLVENEDPYALGRVGVVGISYFVAILLSLSWIATSVTRRRLALLFLAGVMIVLGGSYALSGGEGYPVTNITTQTSYICTSYSTVNGSSSGTGFSCTGYPVQVINVGGALEENLFVWAPLVGCVLYSMPVWEGRGTPWHAKLQRLLKGTVPGAAILLNLVGIGFYGSLRSPFSLHVPLNPYPAFGLCDSLTSETGCVYVNTFFMLVDFLFWVAVAALTALAASEFYESFESRRFGRVGTGETEATGV